MMKFINTSLNSFIPTLSRPNMNFAFSNATLKETKVLALVLKMMSNVLANLF